MAQKKLKIIIAKKIDIKISVMPIAACLIISEVKLRIEAVF